LTSLTPGPGSVENPIPRRAARVILVDTDDRVLMFRGTDPGRPGVRYWFTVGGGLDEGETPTEGAARELREETGLDLPAERLGEPVWHQVTDFPYDGRWYRQDQDFFLVRVDTVQVNVDGFDEVERESIEGYQWWSLADLETTSERFYPDELVELLRGILEA
jgi:8-oxo-dGTP pyrophosphatase MutT (NUDIX family)